MTGKYVKEVFALYSMIEGIRGALLERYSDIWVHSQDAGIAARSMLNSIGLVRMAAKDVMVYAAELDAAELEAAERRSSEASVEEQG